VVGAYGRNECSANGDNDDDDRREFEEGTALQRRYQTAYSRWFVRFQVFALSSGLLSSVGTWSQAVIWLVSGSLWVG